MRKQAPGNYSYETYLTFEAKSELKHEFHDGMITAMAGGTLEHGIITSNFIRALPKIDSWTIFPSDVKVHISETNRTFYPDTSIVCGEYKKSEKDQHAITNPVLILEVLSESTAAFDRGEKFTHYRQIPSLREYILISQNVAVVDTYYRTDNGTWEIQTITGLSEIVHLKSVDSKIAMEDIYRLVPGIS